jgi:hypothetical protein
MTIFRENTKTPIPNFVNSRTVPSVNPLSSEIGHLCNTNSAVIWLFVLCAYVLENKSVTSSHCYNVHWCELTQRAR